MQSSGSFRQPSSRANGYEMGGISASISTLHSKGTAELRKLMEDEATYRAFFQELDQVKNVNTVKSQMSKGCVDIAKRNLAMCQEAKGLQTQSRIIRGTELAEAREGLESARRRQDELVKTFAPRSLMLSLESAAREVDQESEEVKRSFFGGHMEFSGFITKYKALRLKYHMRNQTRLAALGSVPGLV